jgi:ribonuclease P protein component
VLDRSVSFRRSSVEHAGFRAQSALPGASVLPKANRVLSAADFKSAVRRGKRVYTPHAVVYLSSRGESESTRFGFIVGKNVGGAVKRNLVRRRLRSIGHDLLEQNATGRDVVVRALPGVDQLAWDTLHTEISEVVNGSVARR